MSLEGDIALFKRIPLFADLPSEQLRLLAFSSTRIELQAGEVLFTEGDPADTGYVVMDGGIRLSRSHASDKKTVTNCEPGSLIGELALFIETERPASATAALATQVLAIDRKLITRMLHEYPHLAMRLRAKLAERLTATVADLTRVRRSLTTAGRMGGQTD